MSQSLRDAIIKSIHGKEFLPLDALDSIVTRSSIDRELRQSSISDSVSAANICNLQSHDTNHSKDRYTSRQKIFAILVLIDEVPLISDFVAEKLTDADLPFEMLKTSRPGKTMYALVPQSRAKSMSFDNYRLQTPKGGWTSNNIPHFLDHQWRVCAPFFTKAEDIGERAYLYSLKPQDVLPFIEFETIEDGHVHFGRPSHLLQGSANVEHVKIHPAHHNFPVKQVNSMLTYQRGRYSNRENREIKVQTSS